MEKYADLTDEDLIARIREEQECDEITEYLMDKYKPLVRKKARAMYLVGGETDDLIQEGMLGLFKALRDFKPEKTASFASFARLCIERQLYSAIQSSNRQKHQPLNGYVSLSDEDAAAELRGLLEENPESIIIDQERTAGMERQIQNTLSKLENQVLKLYLEGMDYIQIADHLKRPVKSIDNALQRIRQKVKNCVMKR